MNYRGRPKKYRLVSVTPKVSQFSPRGKPGRPDKIELTMDEFEAIRLADFMRLSQEKASETMQISQQTFSRILKKARRVIADGIVNGKIIVIHGGHCLANPQIFSNPKQ